MGEQTKRAPPHSQFPQRPILALSGIVGCSGGPSGAQTGSDLFLTASICFFFFHLRQKAIYLTSGTALDILDRTGVLCTRWRMGLGDFAKILLAYLTLAWLA